MRTGENLAAVTPATLLKDVLFAITRAHAGAAAVVDDAGVMLGLICDGDIRRTLLEDEDALHKPCGAHMNTAPRTIAADHLAAETLQTMQARQISEMPVLDATGRIIGMLNLKDLLAAGIV
jgi:arabinose-5-phosphate isomerase